ncbi:MAG TPA: TetR/AcrR family transcriptional regulator [Gemmatimonadaceae bacterium]|nr:TetR/AcrR family transcriptional regulator [Gemmatimonadaceae bacterium]
MNAASRPSRSTRDRLLETASRLFYERGFQAVGVDEIAAQSGVAKMTMYRHFPSKDDLVVAYLKRSENAFCDWFERALGTERDPRDKIVAVFTAVGALAQSEQCLGCTFQVSAAEYPDPVHPANRVAVRHKREVRKRFATLAAEAGLRDPDALADELLMLMDGAWVAARMFGRPNPARHVASAAESLLRGHRRG